MAYIGQTNQPLCVRMEEHLSTKVKCKTAVRTHIDKSLGHQVAYFHFKQFQSFEDMPQASTRFKKTEAVLIMKNSPLINKQLHPSGVSFVSVLYVVLIICIIGTNVFVYHFR